MKAYLFVKLLNKISKTSADHRDLLNRFCNVVFVDRATSGFLFPLMADRNSALAKVPG